MKSTPELNRPRPALRKPATWNRILIIGCVALPLITFSGCSPQPPQVEIIRLEPPPALLLETPEPRLTGKDNEAMLNLLLGYRAALRKANADKAAIREWVGHEREESK